MRFGLWFKGKEFIGYVPILTEEERETMVAKKAAKKVSKRTSAKADAIKRSEAARKGAITRAKNKAAAKAADMSAVFAEGEASYNTDAVAEDNVFYVVNERGFMSAKAIALHTTRDAANVHASLLEKDSKAPYNKFTVQRVELVA